MFVCFFHSVNFHVIYLCSPVLTIIIVFRCYSCADLQSIPSCVQECWELLSSEAFFILLSNLTGLSLHYLCTNEDDSENEEGKSETENRDTEGDAQAGGSSTEADASSRDNKKDKGDYMCLWMACFQISFYIYNNLHVNPCRTSYLCWRSASLGAWGLYTAA